MLDIEKFCSHYRIPLLASGHHHCHEGWVQLHCPVCAGGREGWHLGFNLQWGNFHCWRCGSLSFLRVVGAILHTNRKYDILEVVQRFQTGRKDKALAEIERKREATPPPGLVPLSRVHRLYLRRRNFNPTPLAKLWGLWATQHLSGIWNWRIIIPIRDRDGLIVAYQGRAIKDGVHPKYRTSKNEDSLIDPRHLLYGLDHAKNAVVIVEGAADVWRIGPGAVATLGIGWKLQQANRLRCFDKRYILFDPEPKAQQQALSLAECLSVFGGTTEVISGYKTDPGNMTPTQVRRLRRKLGLPPLG